MAVFHETLSLLEREDVLQQTDFHLHLLHCVQGLQAPSLGLELPRQIFFWVQACQILQIEACQHPHVEAHPI